MSLLAANYKVHRRHPRAPILARAKIANEPVDIGFEIVQISEGGAFLQTADMFPISAILPLELSIPSLPAQTVQAKIIDHISQGESKIDPRFKGIGCEFIEPNKELVQGIRSHVLETKEYYKQLYYHLSLNNIGYSQFKDLLIRLHLFHIQDRHLLKIRVERDLFNMELH